MSYRFLFYLSYEYLYYVSEYFLYNISRAFRLNIYSKVIVILSVSEYIYLLD